MADLAVSPNLPTPEQPSLSQESYLYMWSIYGQVAQTANSNINAVNSALSTTNTNLSALQTTVNNLPSSFVTSITDTAQESGAITFTGPAVQQSGASFNFGFPGGLVLSYQEYADPAANVPVVYFCSVLTSNAHGVSFVLPSAAANPNTFFLLSMLGNTAVPVIGTGGDTIDSNEGRGHVLYASNGVNQWRNVLSINLP